MFDTDMKAQLLTLPLAEIYRYMRNLLLFECTANSHFAMLPLAIKFSSC